MSLWGFISGLLAIIPLSVIVKWWSDRQTRLHAEAKGSRLTVEDGAQDLGDPKKPLARVRWTELRVRNWVDTDIVIKRIKITWPPFATAALLQEMEANPSLESFKSQFDFPKGRSDRELRLRLLIRVRWFLKPLPTFMSRLRLKVVAETADARRRRVALVLRSNEVDWSEKPIK